MLSVQATGARPTGATDTSHVLTMSAVIAHLALNGVVICNELHATSVAAGSVLAAEEVVGEAAGAVSHSPAPHTTNTRRSELHAHFWDHIASCDTRTGPLF